MMVGFNGHGRDLVRDHSYNRRHESTASLLDTIEKRTQKTYRYGIGLVCIGATLNWLGFAQGNSYIDPLRYLGVASVISGSFCVCLAMCRWLGRPMSGHLSSLEEDSLSGRSTGDVHVINVAVPMFVSPDNYRPSKPPDYEIVAAAGELPPPNYDEAIKLTPGSLIDPTSRPISPLCQSCGPSPSHSTCPLLLISKEPTKSIDATGSPPPPYHPSPTRRVVSPPPSSNLNSYLTNSHFNRSVSSINLMNSSSSHRHQSPEHEHLLQPSEEVGGETVSLVAGPSPLLLPPTSPTKNSTSQPPTTTDPSFRRDDDNQQNMRHEFVQISLPPEHDLNLARDNFCESGSIVE